MSRIPEYREIMKEDLERLKALILPDIYEELQEQEEIGTEYIAIASWLDDTPAGVIIADPEGNGDINLLSIWTAPEFRRMGIASALRDKLTEVAVALYDWEEGQYGDDILLKTMYCLREEYRKPFEEWLVQNDFTDFGILKQADGTSPEIRSATAEIHIFRT